MNNTTNQDDPIDVLKGFLARIVGEFNANPPSHISFSMIHERALRDGILNQIVGYAKDPRKALGWILIKLRRRRLIDTQGRAFVLEKDVGSRSFGYQLCFTGEDEPAPKNDSALGSPGNYESHDLFGEPLAKPSPELLEALAHRDLIEILASARLIRDISKLCRDGGEPAGWTCLMDGIPTVFPIGMNHTLRKPFAALAGLIDDPVLGFLAIERPDEAEIQQAEAELAILAAERFAAVAEYLRNRAESQQ